MQNAITSIITDYKTEIISVEESNLYDFQNVERGIQISRKYLQKLRMLLRNKKFKNKEDQITFFVLFN